MSLLHGLRSEKWLIRFNSEMRPLKASSVLLDSASWDNANVLCPSDVDECEGGDACCAQLCINYSGGYECGCQEGFRISSDGCGCDGKFLLSHGSTGLLFIPFFPPLLPLEVFWLVLDMRDFFLAIF